MTAPRGNNNPRSARPSVSPVVFLVAAKKAGMKALRRLRPPSVLRRTDRDADDPAARPSGTAPTRSRSANINVLIASHAAVRAARSGSPSTATRRSRPTRCSASPGRTRRAT